MATEQDVLRVARENIDAFSSGDRDRFRANLAADAVYDELATGRRVQGADKVTEVSWSWRQAFPDARGTITNALASGETAVLEILWEGTQTGALATPGGELPASGRRVRIPAVQVIRVSGGKLQEGRHYFDMFGMLQQLGAVPGPAQASAGTSR
ncbi:MAG TPA: ester cyclase [Chloroflexota bacterium]